MARFGTTFIISLVILVMLCSSGCLVYTESENATVTCYRFDRFLGRCYPTCAAEWDCEYWYDSLDYDSQILLDDCADCLYVNRGRCADCVVGGDYCLDILGDYLGFSCTWW